MPPVGFGKRNKDGSSCLFPGCRNVHEDVPEEDLEAAKELKIYLMDRDRLKREQGGCKGKDGAKGHHKGGGKDNTKGNGKGSPAGTHGKGDDPLQSNDSWADYARGK